MIKLNLVEPGSAARARGCEQRHSANAFWKQTAKWMLLVL